MTQLATPTHAATAASPAPRRRTIVALGVAILVLYAAFMATGTDLGSDAKLADITDHYGDISQTVNRVSAYVAMVFVALLLFYGAALRNAVRASGRSWFGDVAFLGFAALAATTASWTVIDAALWSAVDYGDAAAIRAIVTLSDASFLPLMASMIAMYVGTALAGLTTGVVPRWLAIASLVVGVIAPLGPLGFVGALLLPLWVVAVALTVRLEPSA